MTGPTRHRVNSATLAAAGVATDLTRGRLPPAPVGSRRRAAAYGGRAGRGGGIRRRQAGTLEDGSVGHARATAQSHALPRDLHGERGRPHERRLLGPGAGHVPGDGNRVGTAQSARRSVPAPDEPFLTKDGEARRRQSTERGAQRFDRGRMRPTPRATPSTVRSARLRPARARAKSRGRHCQESLGARQGHPKAAATDWAREAAVSIAPRSRRPLYWIGTGA